MVLSWVQPGATLLSWKNVGLYDQQTGAPSKHVCICFEQFAIYFLRPYAGDGRRRASIVKVWLYKSIAQQSYRWIIEIVALPP